MLGQSFAPLGDPNERPQSANGGQVNPVQEAIKLLSLKLPRVVGAAAPAPPQLLMGAGRAGLTGLNPLTGRPAGATGGGGDDTNPLMDFLRRMMGGSNSPTPNFQFLDGEDQSGGGGVGLLALPPGSGDTPGGGFGTAPSPQRPAGRPFGTFQNPPSY